ncbi:serine/threonine protein kinase [Streptomyces chrestomyceticus JCM 4735]|uniref:non-specific serine/threonine protein kinase n=1 Tax=Streptomyces chrestomyceticus JCM 4735 TaxID=1306181 RepID=A0A7U9Q1H5_9ACTN|nr:serine/threonine protein kinase [Streptomyces chrestomyceticus JCM 4735]
MGEVFAGRYELIDPIGRGGVGAVWRAWDQRRRRYVAAKVLQQSDAHTLLRFVREQAVRIDHPHVLAPASWAADDDKVLFTMDLVHGGSLAHLVGDYGPLPPRLVCVLLDQLLSGLTAVHAEGIVHRDIKPANVLLESTGTGRPHVRLSDFGIAMRKGEPRLTDANYVVGTPGYFAPEQMLGAEPDFPGDLFAVGLVAVNLLTGAKPDAQSLVEHFTEHGTPEAPEDIAEPLWQVLANLLQPDPELRFKTAAGARKALLAAAELLPEATIEDEAVEVFDHIGPLPAGFGPDGPLRAEQPGDASSTPPAPATPPVSMSDTGGFPLAPPSSGIPAPQHPAAGVPGAEEPSGTGRDGVRPQDDAQGGAQGADGEQVGSSHGNAYGRTYGPSYETPDGTPPPAPYAAPQPPTTPPPLPRPTPTATSHPALRTPARTPPTTRSRCRPPHALRPVGTGPCLSGVRGLRLGSRSR